LNTSSPPTPSITIACAKQLSCVNNAIGTTVRKVLTRWRQCGKSS
jgi:hypothetical protein